MSRDTLRPRGKTGAANLKHHSTPRKSSDFTHLDATCPVCGRPGKLNIDRKPHRSGGGLVWLYGCFTCRAAGVGDYLTALAEAMGTTKARLLEGPNGLGFEVGPPRRRAKTAPVPSWATIMGRHSRLLADDGAMAYLTAARGLTETTINIVHLGLSEAGIHFPVLRDRCPVNDVVRGRDGTYKARAGRRARLYPGLPSVRGTTVLVAGMLDALLARQNGLKALTTTCGTSLPGPLLHPLSRDGRAIAVVYDVGEERAAERNAERLCAAGANAWAVRLPLDEGKADVADWFAKYGRSGERLRRVIERAGRAGR
jgi:hypothetical protein